MQGESVHGRICTHTKKFVASRAIYYTTRTKMTGPRGLEPLTSCVTGRRSDQLSYDPKSGAVTRLRSEARSLEDYCTTIILPPQNGTLGGYRAHIRQFWRLLHCLSATNVFKKIAGMGFEPMHGRL